MQAKIAEVLRLVPAKAGAALYQEAEVEMTESKRRVPVDTGTLRASGHVQQSEMAADGVSVTMGYGGPAVDYALIVHEDLEAHHAVGEAKFLENVLRESAPFLLERIAKRIKL